MPGANCRAPPSPYCGARSSVSIATSTTTPCARSNTTNTKPGRGEIDQMRLRRKRPTTVPSSSFAGPRRVTPPGMPLEALPEIDFVLLSHDHYDHTDFDSIQRLAALGVRFVVPVGIGEIVADAGGEAIELDWWGEVEIDGLRVVCVPAQHFSGRSLVDTDRRLWAGWVVVGPTRRFYHAGDTGYFDGFREIGRRFGPIDLAAIPIGAYRPEKIMRWVHVDPEEALQAAEDVGAKSVVPMHFGTFDLTEEPLDEPPARFRLEATRRELDPERVRVLAVGETRRF